MFRFVSWETGREEGVCVRMCTCREWGCGNELQLPFQQLRVTGEPRVSNAHVFLRQVLAGRGRGVAVAWSWRGEGCPHKFRERLASAPRAPNTDSHANCMSGTRASGRQLCAEGFNPSGPGRPGFLRLRSNENLPAGKPGGCA